MQFTAKWYDPPSGWQYGFPKEWPQGLEINNANVRNQLIKDGYPNKDIDMAVRYCRFGG